MTDTASSDKPTPVWQVVLVWIVVLVPLAWGLVQTLLKAGQLFG